ncbi:MAG: mechanosensitive ion channel [Gammaproteobacteria bacterium]|nr:mechanosensitive ion channel [Gammaproteobacteria bacterium]
MTKIAALRNIFLLYSSLLWLMILSPLLAYCQTNSLSDDLTNDVILEQRLLDEQNAYKLSKDFYIKIEKEASLLLNNIKNGKRRDVNNESYLEQFRLEASKIEIHAKQVAIDRDDAAQDVLSGENNIYQLEERLQSYLGLTVPSLGNNQSLNNNIQNLQALIKENRALLDINKKRLLNLNRHLDLLNKAKVIAGNITEELRLIVEDRNKQRYLVFYSEQEAELNKQIKNWLEIELQYKKELSLNDLLSFNINRDLAKYNRIHTNIAEAENSRRLLELQLNLLRLETRVSDISKYFEEKNKEGLKNKKNLVERVDRLKVEADTLKELVNNKINLIKASINVLNKEYQVKTLSVDAYNAQTEMLHKFTNAYTQKVKEINKIVSQLASFSENLNELYMKDISVRQKLPSSLYEWQAIIEDIFAIPYLLGKQILSARYQLIGYFESVDDSTLDILKILEFILIECIIISLIILFYKIIIFLRSKYDGVYSELHRDRFSSSAFYIIVKLLDDNKLFLAVLFNIYSLFWLTNVTGIFIKIIFWISLVFLIYRVIIKLCYMFLIENIEEISGDDRRLFYGLKYSLLLGAILAVLMILSQELRLPITTQNFIDRSSMLFLLAVSYPLIINWQVVPQLIIDSLTPKPYVRKAIWLIGLIVPITILSNAALGIIGYVNLAWKIALAELQLSLVIALWLIFKGLLNELMEIIFRFFIRNVTNGWLWTESVLKPLQTVLNVVLFVSACIGLVFIYGWNSGVDLVTLIHAIVNFYLVTVSGVDIFVKDFLIICIIFGIVIWATKWSREFSYRWLYSKTKDLGVRNSLAVFTQYSILVVGLIIILRFIGFPAQTLTVAVGGLLFFLGFGLREILSNYVSGLILLIERPIRVGDFITVGEYEGKVTKIGMRSLTVQSFDNMEVIVPNTDTINKPLTNWTFKDTIIRLELELRISYDESLEKIRELLEGLFASSEEILKDPKPKIYCKEFSESAVIVKMYFFIDLNKTPSRGAVRTSVMLAISNIFKEHGIKIAYPIHMVNINNNL